MKIVKLLRRKAKTLKEERRDKTKEKHKNISTIKRKKKQGENWFIK